MWSIGAFIIRETSQCDELPMVIAWRAQRGKRREAKITNGIKHDSEQTCAPATAGMRDVFFVLFSSTYIFLYLQRFNCLCVAFDGAHRNIAATGRSEQRAVSIEMVRIYV